MSDTAPRTPQMRTSEEQLKAQLATANKRLDAVHELHASYLYENSETRERRCLTCNTAYPCRTRQELDSQR